MPNCFRIGIRAAAAALAMLLAICGTAPEVSAAETQEEIVLDGMEEAPAEAGESALLPPEGEPENTPVPVDPTQVPTPEPTATPEPEIPFYSSVNYPEGKINFENEIWRTLTKDWGLTGFQAAGLMSSIQAESSFCPYNAQFHGGSDDRGVYLFSTGDSVGFGLCQWTSAGRKERLYSYAKSKGSAALVWDFDTQMEYLRRELDLDTLKATTSLYEAAEWVVLRFERPSQRYSNSWPGTRYEFGKRIYKTHTGKAYDEPPLNLSIVREGGGTDYIRKSAAPGDVLGTITVNSNYYWWLTLTRESEPGWLKVRCAGLYNPNRMEDCVCGNACDGDKQLQLVAAKVPPRGEKWSATLSFEIYRKDHLVKTVPVSLICTGGGGLATDALAASSGLVGTALLGALLDALHP